MTLSLSQELADALNAADKGGLDGVDPNDNGVGLLVDGTPIVRRWIRHAANVIANGIAARKAGTQLEWAY